MLPIKFPLDSPAALEKKSFENVEKRRTDDGSCLSLKLSWSLRHMGAKTQQSLLDTIYTPVLVKVMLRNSFFIL